MGDISMKRVKHETTVYNTTKFSQPKPNMAVAMHWNTVGETVVNNHSYGVVAAIQETSINMFMVFRFLKM